MIKRVKSYFHLSDGGKSITQWLVNGQYFDRWRDAFLEWIST